MLSDGEVLSLRPVIEAAKALQRQTEDFIEDLLGDMQGDFEARDSRECLSAFFYNTLLTSDPNYYWIVCGDYNQTHRKGGERVREMSLFFRCLRLLVRDQLGGFASRTFSDVQYAIECLGENGGRSVDTNFLSVETSGTNERLKSRSAEFDRKYVLASFLRAVFNARSRLGDECHELVSFCKGLFDGLSWEDLSPGDLREMDGVPSGEGGGRGTVLRRLVDLHRLELSRLLGLLGKGWGRQELPPSNSRLFENLERLLTRGNERALPLEVALILRVLGSRYLNGEPKCEPWWRTAFSEGIKFVLHRQSEIDGGWSLEGYAARSYGALINHFSPLTHVMELGVDVLSEHAEGLSRSAMIAIGCLGDRMEALQSSWDALRESMVGGDDNQRKSAERRIPEMIELLLEALSVSTITYDRLRDVLSESILREFSAFVPHAEDKWRNVSTSFDFRRNLEEGVIRKWVSVDERRPGAVLVFGPPGTGKTTAAKLVAGKLNDQPQFKARETQWKFVEFTPADFARDGIDRIVASAERIFQKLKHVRRCVVFMDEMEEFLVVRDANADRGSRLVTTSFLPLLQEVVHSREIILIVATNLVGRIDPAVTRRGRFDLILPLGPPGRDSRRETIDKYCRATALLGAVTEASGVSFEEALPMLAEYTMGYSVAELFDYLEELRGKLVGVERLGKAGLEMLLWLVRSERIPTALSGGVGCTWELFVDEARRFSRFASECDPGFDGAAFYEYWKEPDMPQAGDRSND